MNYSTAIFLINDKARMVMGHYEADTATSKATRTMFKTLDPALKVGDLALVQSNTRHNVTVVKISDVDVDFDIETSTKIDWVIGKVDISEFERLEGAEQDAIKRIQSAEKTRKREELKKTLLADVDVGGMSIAAIGHDTPAGEA